MDRRTGSHDAMQKSNNRTQLHCIPRSSPDTPKGWGDSSQVAGLADSTRFYIHPRGLSGPYVSPSPPSLCLAVSASHTPSPLSFSPCWSPAKMLFPAFLVASKYHRLSALNNRSVFISPSSVIRRSEIRAPAQGGSGGSPLSALWMVTDPCHLSALCGVLERGRLWSSSLLGH